MKIKRKYLSITTIAIVSLIWLSVSVRSTDEEGQRVHDNPEDIPAREAFRRLELQDENGHIPPDGLRKAYEQKNAMPFLPEAWGEFMPNTISTNGSNVPFWNSIGPGNVGGRMRSIIIHPINPSFMWVGAVAGGIWNTTNGGETWSTTTDDLPNLAVNCMAIDPTNPLILYAGTGEGFFNEDQIQGHGILKSTDGGAQWRPLASTVNFGWVNRLAVSPVDSQVLLAGTQFGLKRSTDGGTNWIQRLNTQGILDVRFRPKIGNATAVAIPDVPEIQCVAATRNDGAFYSANDGVDWLPAGGLPASPGRIELSYSQSEPLIVYASVENGGRLYRSNNGGFSFVPTGASGTGVNHYHNALWVDPFNSNRLIVGGIRLWRSENGGASLTRIDTSEIHVDHHAIVEHPGYNGTTNQTVYFGTDGGIYQTDNALGVPVLWTDRNYNLRITQFYGAAGNVASGTIIGGTQDNFTLRYRPQDGPEDWRTVLGGDGGFCAADQTDPNYFYGEIPALQIFRSTDGGEFQTTHYIWGDKHNRPNGIPSDCGDHPCANFIAPFILDPNNPNTILAGARSLWRSTNVKHTIPSQVSWVAIKDPVGGLFNYISAIAVAPGNSNIIWVGYNDGSVYYTTNGMASIGVPGVHWTQVHGLPQGRKCMRITIGAAPQPDDPLVAVTKYVTFTGFKNTNVWRTENNGGIWNNIHHNLPHVPVRSLVISRFNPDILYVGTEAGIFASANGGSSWSPGSPTPGHGGPANVSVDELFWMGPKLIAATHGRGLFTSPSVYESIE